MPDVFAVADALVSHAVGQFGEFELLRTGISGANTYLLTTANEVMVLKVTPADSPVHVWERSVREVSFYQTLATTIPLRTPEVLASYGPSSHGCALLLRAYDAPSEITAWDESQDQTAARQLAMLHATYWNQTETLKQFAWLRHSSAHCGIHRDAALTAWRGLWTQERLAAVFDPAAEAGAR